MNSFLSTFEYKLIYVFRINDEAHKGLLKIGEAACNTDKTPADLTSNCHELNMAAKFRINQYTTTAGIAYDLLYTELAQKTVKSGDKVKTVAFRDYDVHEVLKRSGIKNHYFDTERKANVALIYRTVKYLIFVATSPPLIQKNLLFLAGFFVLMALPALL